LQSLIEFTTTTPFRVLQFHFRIVGIVVSGSHNYYIESTISSEPVFDYEVWS